MIYILLNKQNKKAITSIEISQYYNKYIQYYDLNDIDQLFKNNKINNQDSYIIYLSNNEYINTIQLDTIIEKKIENKLLRNDMIIFPELFTNLEKHYLISNNTDDYYNKILFNISHSILYSYSTIYNLYTQIKSAELIFFLDNPRLLYPKISNCNLEKCTDFLLISNIKITSELILSLQSNNNNLLESAKSILKILKNPEYGDIQNV